jgi:hypothetical protein
MVLLSSGNEQTTMKTKVTIGLVSVLAALLTFVPFDAGAAVRGHGVGMHAFHPRAHFAPRRFGHFARHHFFRNRQAFVLWPWYGYYDAPYPYNDYSTPQVVVAPEREPPRAACQHSEQTATVPSANGGTAQVTILRC